MRGLFGQRLVLCGRLLTERPEIADCADAEEFRRWYYLKAELQAYARAQGLKTSGGKFQITDRIAYFLEHGEAPVEALKVKPTSGFDWHSAELTPETVITDSYKNTQNVRRFMKEAVGPGFTFSIALMDWAKANQGRTLAEMAEEAKRLAAAKRAGAKAPDQPHNQYNAYTRAYFAHKPDGSAEEVRALWKARRGLPGPYVFHPDDLRLLES